MTQPTAEQERVAIVAWLRELEESLLTDDAGGAIGNAADGIERGDHLTQQHPNPTAPFTAGQSAACFGEEI